ncbi:MAG: TetR/AcrR family transcriptional regulator [Chitinophagales bacterium]|nr:TetR/AcrR family transcriptional regulator [Chitinophagales bacterium]
MRPKDIHKEKAIIDKTLDIVYETGIAGIKMSVLAKRVGISPSTLYVYFETKEDLIVSIGTKLLKQIAQRSSQAVIDKSTFKEKLKATWTGLLHFLINNEREVNFIDQWKQSPYFNKTSETVWHENKRGKSELFQEGRDSGILKDLDENMIHAVMSGIAKNMVSLIKSGELKLSEEVIEESFTIVWDALKR